MTATLSAPLDFAARRSRARDVLGALFEFYRVPHRGSASEPLVDGLFVSSDTDARGLTGISELSVSFGDGRPVTVRALSEVLHRRTLDPALTAAGLRWGLDTLGRASACAAAPYASGLFRQLHELVYATDVARPAPLFRLGIATELGHAAPVIKTYFDLHAVRADRRSDVLGRIAELLGETAGLAAFRRSCPDLDAGDGRIVGVDFGAGGAIRSKFYWSARHLGWDDLVAASREISGDRHTATIRRLEHEVAAASGTLASVLVSACGAGERRSLKLDVCVARLYAHDGEAYDATERIRATSLAGASPAPLTLVSGHPRPDATRCVQQYLGLELSAHASPRVTLYYRPLGFETEFLNPILVPAPHA